MNLSKIAHLNPRTLLDIGANLGWFAEEAQKTWPNAQITCIEGNRACETVLKEKGLCYKIALLGDCVRKVTFYKATYSDLATGNSYKKELTEFFNDCQEEERELETLADMFGPDDQFDLIKLDTQGSELDIICGGMDLCRKAKAIIMEVAVGEYNEGAPQWQEVIDFMAVLGFDKTLILDDIVHPLNRQLIQHDVLFTKSIDAP